MEVLDPSLYYADRATRHGKPRTIDAQAFRHYSDPQRMPTLPEQS
jgi:hypothetical protein